jgi:hypothetical protein
MATIYGFAPYHKSDDDLPFNYETIELGYNPFICFENSKSSIVEL